MKKISLLAGMLLLLALVPLSSVFSEPASPPFQEAKPTLIPIDSPRTAPAPPDERTVAILRLQIQSDARGNVEYVELIDARIENSYAPNVFYRGGAWTVALEGGEPMRYGMQDPRWMTAFPSSEGEWFEREFLSLVEYDLVVPLYYYEWHMQVQVISLYDERGDLIFSVEADHEGWR